MPTRPLLLLLLPLAFCGVALGQSLPVSPREFERLKELQPRSQELSYHQRVRSKLKLPPAEVRRVAFRYGAPQRSAVRGVLLSFEKLVVERYRLETEAEALRFAFHQRRYPRPRHLLEVRGRDVLVLSGYLTARNELARVREAAWSNDKSPDLLRLHSTTGEELTWFSKSTLSKSPLVKEKVTEVKILAEFSPDLPGVTRESSQEGIRLWGDEGQVSLLSGPGGGTLLVSSPDEDGEVALRSLLANVLTPSKPTRGLVGALSGKGRSR